MTRFFYWLRFFYRRKYKTCRCCCLTCRWFYDCIEDDAQKRQAYLERVYYD